MLTAYEHLQPQTEPSSNPCRVDSIHVGPHSISCRASPIQFGGLFGCMLGRTEPSRLSHGPMLSQSKLYRSYIEVISGRPEQSRCSIGFTTGQSNPAAVLRNNSAISATSTRRANSATITNTTRHEDNVGSVLVLKYIGSSRHGFERAWSGSGLIRNAVGMGSQ